LSARASGQAQLPVGAQEKTKTSHLLLLGVRYHPHSHCPPEVRSYVIPPDPAHTQENWISRAAGSPRALLCRVEARVGVGARTASRCGAAVWSLDV
jgi:hypothetical protein